MSAEVLVLGSVSRDVTVSVTDFPAPGETVLGREVVYGLGGKGANQAVAAALTGVATEFAGCVGSDEVGAALRTELEERGVGTTWLRTLAGEDSGSAHITVDSRGENSIAVVPAANARVDEALVHRLAAEGFSGASVLLTQGEIPVAALEALAQVLGPTAAQDPADATDPTGAAGHSVADDAAAAGHRAAARPRWILNLAPAAEVSREALAAADLLVVNETEATAILRRLGGEDGPGGQDEGGRTQGEAARTARRLTRLSPGIVLTLGAAGSVVAVRGEDRALSIPATPAPSVVDTTGAGDAFTGVFGAALATRLREDPGAWGLELLAECAGIAAREAAKVVARPGASASYDEFSLAPR